MKKVAVIGAGYWGKNLIRNFHDLGALGAICDNNKETQEIFKQKYKDVTLYETYEDVLNDRTISGVAISTPAVSHYDQVKKGLLAGKDVFVEKPVALSFDDGKELVDLAEELDRILMVGHLLWYHPAVLKLKQMIDSGKLGKLQYIYSNRLNLGKIRREENILWSFAPHDISVVLGLLGEYPETIQVQGGNYLQKNITDVTTTLLGFPSGVKAHIFVSWLHPFKEQKLVVAGSGGMAVFNDTSASDKLIYYKHTIGWDNQLPVAIKAEGESVSYDDFEPLKHECSHFLDCIGRHETPLTDGREGLRVLSVLQACQKLLEGEGVSGQLGAKKYFVHETAVLDKGVIVGDGCKIWHFSHLLEGSRIGKKCNIGQNVVVGPRAEIGNGVKVQNNVSVYEGVVLEDDVFCGPSMVFTNVHNPRSFIPRMSEIRKTLVRKGATLGANCTIICGVTIGRYSFIGAGAVVTKDVPDHSIVAGNPATQIGWVCRCATRLGEDLGCHACGMKYKMLPEGKSLQESS